MNTLPIELREKILFEIEPLDLPQACEVDSTSQEICDSSNDSFWSRKFHIDHPYIETEPFPGQNWHGLWEVYTYGLPLRYEFAQQAGTSVFRNDQWEYENTDFFTLEPNEIQMEVYRKVLSGSIEEYINSEKVNGVKLFDRWELYFGLDTVMAVIYPKDRETLKQRDYFYEDIEEHLRLDLIDSYDKYVDPDLYKQSVVREHFFVHPDGTRYTEREFDEAKEDAELNYEEELIESLGYPLNYQQVLTGDQLEEAEDRIADAYDFNEEYFDEFDEIRTEYRLTLQSI